jgi:hypothetical protein
MHDSLLSSVSVRSSTSISELCSRTIFVPISHHLSAERNRSRRIATYCSHASGNPADLTQSPPFLSSTESIAGEKVSEPIVFAIVKINTHVPKLQPHSILDSEPSVIPVPLANFLTMRYSSYKFRSMTVVWMIADSVEDAIPRARGLRGLVVGDLV